MDTSFWPCVFGIVFVACGTVWSAIEAWREVKNLEHQRQTAQLEEPKVEQEG